MKEIGSMGENLKPLPIIDLAHLETRESLASGLRGDQIDDYMKFFLKRSNGNGFDRIPSYFYDEMFEGRSIGKTIRLRMDDYGLRGQLSNFAIDEIRETEDVANLSFLKKSTQGRRKIFVVSADYQSEGSIKGRVFNMFCVNLSIRNSKSEALVPVLTVSGYIQLPLCLDGKMHGKGRHIWMDSKNAFEK